jgi:hypothetical protein
MNDRLNPRHLAGIEKKAWRIIPQWAINSVTLNQNQILVLQIDGCSGVRDAVRSTEVFWLWESDPASVYARGYES